MKKLTNPWAFLSVRYTFKRSLKFLFLLHFLVLKKVAQFLFSQATNVHVKLAHTTWKSHKDKTPKSRLSQFFTPSSSRCKNVDHLWCGIYSEEHWVGVAVFCPRFITCNMLSSPPADTKTWMHIHFSISYVFDSEKKTASSWNLYAIMHTHYDISKMNREEKNYRCFSLHEICSKRAYK